jgi:hypothetical protein
VRENRQVLCLSLVVIVLSGSLAFAATTPSSGTVSPASPTVSFSGGPFSVGNPAPLGDAHPVCTDSNCGVYALTVQVPASDFNTYRARLTVGWTNSGSTTTGGTESDFDVYVYSGDFATGTQRASAATIDNPEMTTFDVTGGTYTIYVEAFDVSPTVTFNASVTLLNAAQTTVPWPTARPNPTFPTGTPRFYNYHPPSGVAEDAGEPSIGVNWNSEKVFGGKGNGGTVTYFGGFLPYMLRTTFDDRTNPATVTWEQAPLTVANAPRVYGDPILFTDSRTGRTFVSQELGLTPLGSTMEWTDNDGLSFTPSEGSGAPSGVDHQTVGGGPFHAPIPTGINPLYPNGVWYCSQAIADAVCSISLDGGITFGPAVPMYSVADCSGLHGHIKIGPDGTAYVPNRACGGSLPYHTGAGAGHALLVSENNGISWNIRRVQINGQPITGSTKTDRDPAVAVGNDGTVYFAYQAADGHSRVAVSTDKGLNWIRDTDVGTAMGVQNALFHVAVAGDAGRAAIGFFGTETGGANYNQPDFPGVWYLYIATTLDGGQTWTTQNATPGDPVQRGGICGGGGCRNLLDFFDATIDKRGRVLIGYDDGCVSETCISGQRQYGMIAQNDFTAKAVIARQASGKRMFAAYDAEAGPDVNPGPPPPPPPHASSCDGNVISDAAGDAAHPLLGANGGSLDAVDITAVKFSVNGDKLATTTTVKNLSLTPVTGTLGTYYYVTWTAARKNADGTIATRTFATRMSVSITGAIAYTFGQYDQVNDAFVGTTTAVTGSNVTGPNGTITVEVPLSLLGNPTIPVTDAAALPAVIEPYAVTILHEQAVRFTQPADRAPNAGSTGANWAVCVAPLSVCVEENDASISYSAGWHNLSAEGASGGKYAMHAGKSPTHSASVDLDVPAGRTGTVRYYYATSTKGGSAELFLDNVSKGVVSYHGTEGSSKDPVFGAFVEIAGLASGAHTLELRNMMDAVYIDRICLQSASTSGQAASGPGQTSSNSGSAGPGQQVLSQLNVPANAESISIVAESSPLGLVRIVLVSPTGLSIATSEGSNGLVTLDSPITQGGLYLVKVLNLSLGPVNVWTAATPRVAR